MEFSSAAATVMIDDNALNVTKGPFWLGLTGGIGSGKSAVSRVWQDLGATIADADVIAREIVEPGQPALAEIVQRFGAGVIQDGVLNRRALASIVFADAAALQDLNTITHPRIWKRAEAILKSVKSGSIGVYDAAILAGSGSAKAMNAIAVVVDDMERRLERLVTLRGMDKDDALARIAGQLSDEELINQADIIIYNRGTLADLHRVCADTYAYIVRQMKLA